MTESVLAAFAAAFPLDWAEIEQGIEANMLARLSRAGSDPTIAVPVVAEDQLCRAAERYPAVVERLVAVHEAYERSQEQLGLLNDKLEQRGAAASTLPWEEVRDWFHSAGNYVDPIDQAAEAIALSMENVTAGAIEDRLLHRHGVTVARDAILPGAVLRHYNPVARRLAVDRSVAIESQLFLLAHQLMRMELTELIDGVTGDADLRSGTARQLLGIGLSNYAAGAFLMPYERFRIGARSVRHDIDVLRHQFGVSFEQVCHRLSNLQRPGACGVPMFFCRVDLAGNITKRHSATRLEFARFGGACPMWVVHEAVAIPDRVWRQLAETPDGVRYIAIAKGLVKPSTSYTRRSRRYAVTLGCEIAFASEFIYADALDLNGLATATPVGNSCRICPRTDCEQRAFPQIGKPLVFDPNYRTVVPYQQE